MPKFDIEEYADKETEKLERRLTRLYRDLFNELGIEEDKYFNGYDELVKNRITGEIEEIHHKGMFERMAEQYELYEVGAYHDPTGRFTDEEMWLRYWAAQEGRGQYWTDMKQTIAERLTNTNIEASEMINGRLPKIYCKSSNNVAEMAKAAAFEKGVVGINFGMIDEYKLKHILTSGETVEMFQKVKVDARIDKDWNMTKLQKAFEQGMVRGENHFQIANRLQSVEKMSRTAAIRNARTAITNTLGAGQQARYDDLGKQGCIAQKGWWDVHDSVPPERPEHWEASGQVVDYDKPFIVGGEELMYPGDPKGSPFNCINCRCRERTMGFRFVSMLTKEQRDIAKIKVRG